MHGVQPSRQSCLSDRSHRRATTSGSRAGEQGILVRDIWALLTATAHLRAVLGDRGYESLARKGETMSIAEIATYAYGHIDAARAELNAVSQ